MNLFITFSTPRSGHRIFTTHGNIYDLDLSTRPITDQGVYDLDAAPTWVENVENRGWQRLSGKVSDGLRDLLLSRLPETNRDMDGYRWVLVGRGGTVALVELLTDDAYRVAPSHTFDSLAVLDGFMF